MRQCSSNRVSQQSLILSQPYFYRNSEAPDDYERSLFGIITVTANFSLVRCLLLADYYSPVAFAIL